MHLFDVWKVKELCKGEYAWLCCCFLYQVHQSSALCSLCQQQVLLHCCTLSYLLENCRIQCSSLLSLTIWKNLMLMRVQHSAACPACK